MSIIRDCLFNIIAATLHTEVCSSNRNLRMRHVVETRTHLLQSNCNKCNKLHRLTLVGLGEAELVNEVTVIVNCYGVVLPSQECCKNDMSECHCVDTTLEFKCWNYFFVTRRDCILCSDSLLNSAVPYCEQYYNNTMLVVWLICNCVRKVFC